MTGYGFRGSTAKTGQKVPRVPNSASRERQSFGPLEKLE